MLARSFTLALAVLAIAITLLAWRNDARSSNLDALSALCSANPSCIESTGGKEGALAFRIRSRTALLRLECNPDGLCLRIEPKAARATVFNAVQLISLR